MPEHLKTINEISLVDYNIKLQLNIKVFNYLIDFVATNIEVFACDNLVVRHKYIITYTLMYRLEINVVKYQYHQISMMSRHKDSVIQVLEF